MAAFNLTPEKLKTLLSYCPRSGEFVWLSNRSGGVKKGSIAGGINGAGYIEIRIGRYKYLAHRLAFLFMCGSFPVQLVDHIDGKPANNSWANLRNADFSINAQNQRAARSDSISKVLGVSWSKQKNKWRADIKIAGKTKYLGCFLSIEDAQAKYLKAKRELHIGCTL